MLGNKRKSKKRTKGQAMIEFMCVLSLYFFLLGFMISGFQLMHNKIVFNLAAYEGVRTAIAYDTSVSTHHNMAEGQAKSKEILKYAIGIPSPTTTISVNMTNKTDTIVCEVSGRMNYLFPIIAPDDGSAMAKTKNLKTAFEMRKERP